jgi:hypothetical protein
MSLRRHADAAAAAPDAPFQHGVHAEHFSYPTDVFVLSLERECRRAGDHLEAGHLRQRVDDFFGQAVAEILVIGIATHVDEREHRNGRGTLAVRSASGIAAAARPSRRPSCENAAMVLS